MILGIRKAAYKIISSWFNPHLISHSERRTHGNHMEFGLLLLKLMVFDKLVLETTRNDNLKNSREIDMVPWGIPRKSYVQSLRKIFFVSATYLRFMKSNSYLRYEVRQYCYHNIDMYYLNKYLIKGIFL